MGDLRANYKVEQQRLLAQIQEQKAAIARQTLVILEMADRKARNLENIEAAYKAIERYEIQLADMEKTHGKLTKAEVDAMSASLDDGG